MEKLENNVAHEIAEIQMARGDEAIIDTAATEVIKYWMFHRSGMGIFLPSAAGGAETIADP